MTELPPNRSAGLINSLDIFTKIIVYSVATLLFYSAIIFILGGNLGPSLGIFSLSILSVLIFICWEFHRFRQVPFTKVILFSLAFLSFLAFLTFLISKIYDKSWDGMAYHQIAISELANGWNPFYETLPYSSQESIYFDRLIVLNLWVNHYAKGLEIFSAILYGVGGSIESGKVFNLFLFLVSFSSVFSLLLKIGRIKWFYALLIAIAAAFNPIVVNQLFSYYLDGAVGALLLILLVVFINILINKTDLSEYFSLAAVLIILINLKFTGLVYAGLFGFAFFIFLLFKKDYVILYRFLGFAVPTGLVAVILIGFNPYIKNTLENGHPFHPLAGKNKVDIISINIPVQLKDANAAEKFLASTFSRSDNFDNRNESDRIKFKIPFTFNIEEVKAFASEGIRLGGFGVLWSGIFILTIVMCILNFFSVKGKNDRVYLMAFVATVLVSVFINPESWWARYVPQFWFLPVILCTFLLYLSKNKIFRGVALASLLILILNSALVAGMYSYSALVTTLKANQELRSMKKSEGPVTVYFDIFTPNELKLKEHNIPYRKVMDYESMPCQEKDKVMKIEYCIDHK